MMNLVHKYYDLTIQRVLEKSRMTREGLAKDHLFVRNKFHDSVYMAILKEEYKPKNNR